MKALFISFLLAIAVSAHSQNKHENQLGCAELNAIFSNPDIYSYFFVSKIKDTVILVDTFNIVHCPGFSLNGHPVCVVNKLLKEISYGEASSPHIEHDSKTYFVIQSFKQKKNTIEMNIWKPLNNHFFVFTLLLKKHLQVKIKLKAVY